MTAAAVRINGPRLWSRLGEFGAIGGTAAGGVTRPALSDEDRRARALLAALAGARGFAVRQDEMANLFVRRAGRSVDAPPVLIGSHLDSQPCGGRFDGALGVLAAFECLETLEDAGIVTDRPIDVVAWTNEEGARYAPGAMGSQAFARRAVPPEWRAVVDGGGMPMGEALAATLAALDVPVRAPGFSIAGYVELHIEQGPILETERIPIGVVTGTQATRWLEVGFDGRAGHAGTTPLAFRRDPMTAATAALNALYAMVMPGDADARFTVGRMRVEPGSVNAIPSAVRFSVDLRHPDAAALDRLEAATVDVCRQAAEDGRCDVAVRRTLDMPAGKFSETLMEAIETAASSLGVASRRLASGAFHDALFIAGVAPTAMIFIPCRDGLSHNEAEYAGEEDVQRGADVLLAVALAQSGE